MNGIQSGDPVRTLVVDDAPLMRRVIQDILSRDDSIELVGTATNGQECLERILELRPDVVTLDIDMPVMNGITAIKNIMVRHQIPIVVISSLIQDGYFAFEALRLGVVDFVPKPSRVSPDGWVDQEELVRTRVRLGSQMRVQRVRRVRWRKRNGVHDLLDAPAHAVIVMGTTLAGPNTIMRIVTQLPGEFKGTLIAVQEIHPKILEPFCAYFNDISPLEVVPITGVQPLKSGRVYLGSTHTGLRIRPVKKGSGEHVVEVVGPTDLPIDQLFETAADHFRQHTCGILLTGLGADGTGGMKTIRAGGGFTIAQKLDSCAYPNLVAHALKEKAADALMSVKEISEFFQCWASSRL